MAATPSRDDAQAQPLRPPLEPAPRGVKRPERHAIGVEQDGAAGRWQEVQQIREIRPVQAQQESAGVGGEIVCRISAPAPWRSRRAAVRAPRRRAPAKATPLESKECRRRAARSPGVPGPRWLEPDRRRPTPAGARSRPWRRASASTRSPFSGVSRITPSAPGAARQRLGHQRRQTSGSRALLGRAG